MHNHCSAVSKLKLAGYERGLVRFFVVPKEGSRKNSDICICVCVCPYAFMHVANKLYKT
jgi:hypothetical protein